MNACIQTQTNSTTPSTARPNVPHGRADAGPAPHYLARQLRKREAERAFEAGVQWFLEVSRTA